VTITVSDGTHTVAALVADDALTVSAGSLRISESADFNAPLTLTGGILTLDGSARISSLALSGGTLGGFGIVTTSGNSTLSGGRMAGTGSFINDGVATLSGTFTLAEGRTFVNNGSTNLTGTSVLAIRDSADFDNTATGVLALEDGSSVLLSNATTAGDARLINAGLVDFSTTATTPVAFDGSGLAGALVNNTSGRIEKNSAGNQAIAPEVKFDNSAFLGINAGTLSIPVTTRLDGVIDVAPGAVLALPASTDSIAGIGGAGTLRLGNGTGTFQNRGNLAPGGVGGIATLRIEGNLQQGPGGTVQLELAGRNASEQDVLAITGNANLGGTLELIALPAFQPNPGDRFPIITFASSSGTFASVIQPAALAATVTSSTTSVTFALSGGFTCLSDVCWTGAVNNLWSNPGNWHTGAVPLAGQSVLVSVPGTQTIVVDAGTQAAGSITVDEDLSITAGSLTVSGAGSFNAIVSLSGGILRLDGDASIARLALGGGTLAIGAGATTTLGGASTWTSGAFQALGTGATLRVDAAAVLALSGSGSRGLSGLALDNAGLVSLAMSGSSLFLSDGAVFTNRGTLRFAAAGNDAISVSSGSGTLRNEGGRIENAAASGNATVTGVVLFNTGGTLATTGASTLSIASLATHAGNLAFDGGVRLTGGVQQFSEGAVVSGPLQLAGASVTFGTPNTVDGTVTTNGRVTYSAGTFNVAARDTLVLAGGLDWNGTNAIGGPGRIAIASGQTFVLNGAGGRGLSGVTVDNDGTLELNMPGGHALFVNDGSRIVNRGTLRFAGDGADVITVSSGAGNLDNTGGTIANAGTGPASIDAVGLTNAGGRFGSNGQSLDVNVGATHSGSIGFTGTGVLLRGGNHAFADGTVVAGTLALSGANAVFGNTTIDGALTYVPTARLDLPTGKTLTFGPGSVSSVARGTWNGGGTVVNQGLLTLSDITLPVSVINQGTLRTGGTLVQLTGPTLDLRSGILDLGAGSRVEKSTGTVAWGSGDITGTGELAFAGGGRLTLSGAGTKVLNGPSFDLSDFNVSGTIDLRAGTLTLRGNSAVAFGSTLLVNGGTFVPAGNVDVKGTLRQARGTTTFTQDGAHTGAFVVDTGGTLAFAGGTHALSGGVSGLGSVRVGAGGQPVVNVTGGYAPGRTTVDGGTLSLDTDATLSTVAVNGGALNVLRTLAVADLSLADGKINGPGNLAVTSRYARTGGEFGSGWNSLSFAQRSGDLVIDTNLSARTIALGAAAGTVQVRDARVSATETVTMRGAGVSVTANTAATEIRAERVTIDSTGNVVVRDARVAASETVTMRGAGVSVTANTAATEIRAERVTIDSTGNVVVRGGANQGSSATVTATRFECGGRIGGDLLLTGGSGAGADAILSGTDVGTPSSELSIGGSIVIVPDAASSARIEASRPETIYLFFPNRSSGGYSVAGASTVTSGSSGFFAGGRPAVIDLNLFIRYGQSGTVVPVSQPAVLVEYNNVVNPVTPTAIPTPPRLPAQAGDDVVDEIRSFAGSCQ
jgi:hypothetical protein